MFSSSGDILNLIIAICITAFTVFICITLYYLISSLRKAHNVINLVENGVSKIEELIEMIESKFKNGGTYLMLTVELMKKAFDMFVTKKNSKKEEIKDSSQKKKTKSKKK
jgi:hypothetical protein